MAGYSKKANTQEQLKEPISRVPAPVRTPEARRVQAPPVVDGGVPVPTAASPAASSIDLTNPAGQALLESLGSPAGLPVRQVDDLPGYATASGRRNVAILLTPEVNALLEKAIPRGGTRGLVIINALRIADAHLRARTPEAVADPWADLDGQPYRRHVAQPVRVTFTLSAKQGITLRDLAHSCEETNMSRLISDAIEYAYEPRPVNTVLVDGDVAPARRR